jgi:transcriptional regulator with XRE-family HTH domain
MNPVATRIQKLLDKRGEKLKTVSDACNVAYYSIYPWWKREHSKADYEKVKAFANYFGVPVGHLLYGDPLDKVPASADRLRERILSLPDSDQKEVESYIDYLHSKRTAT